MQTTSRSARERNQSVDSDETLTSAGALLRSQRHHGGGVSNVSEPRVWSGRLSAPAHQRVLTMARTQEGEEDSAASRGSWPHQQDIASASNRSSPRNRDTGTKEHTAPARWKLILEWRIWQIA